MLLLSGIYAWVVQVPLLQTELKWMLIGERLADGKSMFIDVLDDTGPLSAGVYWIIHTIFGRSLVIYKLIALVLVFANMIYLNGLFMRFKSFDDNTYIPAFVGLILFYFSFDLITLSPALMGTMFLVLAIGQLFSRTVLQKGGSESILLVGLFGGIAACFHFPFIAFLPYIIIVGIIVSGFSFVQFLLSLIGYLVPLTLCGVYYYWLDGLPEFIREYIFFGRWTDNYVYVSYQNILLLFITPLFFTSIGIFMAAIFKSLTINQQKQLQIILIFFGFGIASFFIGSKRAPYQLVVLIPAMIYFVSMLFINLKEGILTTLLTYSFILIIPIMGVSWSYINLKNQSLNTYTIKADDRHQVAEGKRVVVLGKDLGYYLVGIPSTPYLDFYMSKQVLTDIDDFDDLASIYRNFSEEAPEVIVDSEGIFRELVVRLPLLQEKYVKAGQLYLLRK